MITREQINDIYFGLVRDPAKPGNIIFNEGASYMREELLKILEEEERFESVVSESVKRVIQHFENKPKTAWIAEKQIGKQK
jgi:hypothetical protein